MTVCELIDSIGGATALAAAIGVPSTTASNWRLRNSIPSRYHAVVLRFAAGKITADDLVEAHAHLPLPQSRDEAA